MRRVATGPVAATLVAATLVAMSLGGCAVGVEGDFDGVAFAPAQSVQAILDSHVILERRGALVPVERARSSMTVDLWLSGATVPENDTWRASVSSTCARTSPPTTSSCCAASTSTPCRTTPGC
jgi:hypothetical protein